jgi:hypothetical protein
MKCAWLRHEKRLQLVTILHVAQNQVQIIPNPKYTTLLQEMLIFVQKQTQIPLEDQIVLNGRGERLSLTASVQAQLDNANPADYVRMPDVSFNYYTSVYVLVHRQVKK